MKSIIAAVLSIAFLGLVAAPATAGGPPNWAKTKDGARRWKTLDNFGGEAVLDVETGLIW